MMKRHPSLLVAALTTVISFSAATSQASSLQDMYALALENDHQIKADTAAYRAGMESKTIGRAGLLPQISASASISDINQSSTSYQAAVGHVATFETESDNKAYSVSLTQPLFNMAAWFGYKQGQAMSQQAEAQFNADQQALIMRVTEAYFNVLRAIDNMETALAEEKAYAHQLEQTKQRFEVGLTAITDVHEAQAVYDTATATTLEALGNLGIGFEELEVLTGRSHDSASPLVDNFPIVQPEPTARSEWVDFSLQNNHTLKVAKYSAESARQGARAKASGHLPTLTGSYSYTGKDDTDTDIVGVTGIDIDSLTEDQKIMTISLQVPLFSGGRTSSERRQAHQLHMQSQELYNKAQRSTIQSTRSLHLSVTIDVAQVKARKQAITSGQSALEATQAGYEVGTRNLVDVLVAQRNVFNAQRNYDNTRYDYILSMLRLKESAGLLSPKDVQDLNRWLDADKPVMRSAFEQ